MSVEFYSEDSMYNKAKTLTMRIKKSLFLKALIRPFQLCLRNKSKSSLWVIYILFGGLLGVVINLINRWICGDMSFQQALYVESMGGTFYTYAIVLISATIGPLFYNISESKVLHYPDIKSFTITICIFVMIFCAIFYSNLENKLSTQVNVFKYTTFSVDWSQVIFFLLAILLALYSFGIEYLDKDLKNNEDIDASAKYRKDEDKRIDKLEHANPTDTGNGVKL